MARLVMIPLFCMLAASCATEDGKSLLVADGDEALSCPELHQAYKDSKMLGDNAPARRRWLAQLIDRNQCRPLNTTSMRFGVQIILD